MAALSTFTITSASVTSNVITFVGTITGGATPLISGMPMIVTGFVTHANFNGTFVITGGNLTTTVTAALTTANASETHAATGVVDVEGPAVYPTVVGNSATGYGILNRALELFSVPLGNAAGGGNVSGSGQIYPTGRN